MAIREILIVAIAAAIAAGMQATRFLRLAKAGHAPVSPLDSLIFFATGVAMFLVALLVGFAVMCLADHLCNRPRRTVR